MPRIGARVGRRGWVSVGPITAILLLLFVVPVLFVIGLLKSIEWVGRAKTPEQRAGRLLVLALAGIVVVASVIVGERAHDPTTDSTALASTTPFGVLSTTPTTYPLLAPDAQAVCASPGPPDDSVGTTGGEDVLAPIVPIGLGGAETIQNQGTYSQSQFAAKQLSDSQQRALVCSGDEPLATAQLTLEQDWPSSAPTSMTPVPAVSSSGSSGYRAGEYCSRNSRGSTIQGADGTITCEDNDGWRWENG